MNCLLKNPRGTYLTTKNAKGIRRTEIGEWGTNANAANGNSLALFSDPFFFHSVKHQANRNSAKEAIAEPPLMSGTIFSSITLTPSRLTSYSSTSVLGGLKLYCCRTMSWKSTPSADQRNTNSCVRSSLFSMKTRRMRLSFWGWSKRSRRVCSPDCAAVQPDCVPAINAKSTGLAGVSEVISTSAFLSRSNQTLSSRAMDVGDETIMRFLIRMRSKALKAAPNDSSPAFYAQISPD